jgi:hypothetical protein
MLTPLSSALTGEFGVSFPRGKKVAFVFGNVCVFF